MAKTTDYGVFTKNHPETGDEMRRTAYTPAEAVRLRFDGWTEEASAKPARSTSSSTTSTKSASGSTSS